MGVMTCDRVRSLSFFSPSGMPSDGGHGGWLMACVIASAHTGHRLASLSMLARITCSLHAILRDQGSDVSGSDQSDAKRC